MASGFHKVADTVVPALAHRLGGLRLWRMLPVKWRTSLTQSLLSPRLELSQSRPAAAGPPYVLCGRYRSTSSFGWAMHATERVLRKQGHDPAVIDTTAYWEPASERGLALHEPETEALDAPGTLLVHANPQHLGHVFSVLPPSLYASKYIVGCFVWELERIPEDWRKAADFVDEVWAPSTFVREAFVRSGFSRPVKTVPHELACPSELHDVRKRFGLDEDGFLVLTAMNLASGFSRKNPGGALNAYLKAFAEEPTRARLVVKLHGTPLAPACARALREKSKASGCILIEEDLDDAEMWSLIHSCDCVLSLHRAEGFGLLLKQGLMLDKPVVATGWSGNMDFMHGPNAYPVPYDLVPVRAPDDKGYELPGSRWAEPDVDAAAQMLRRVYQEWRNRSSKPLS